MIRVFGHFSLMFLNSFLLCLSQLCELPQDTLLGSLLRDSAFPALSFFRAYKVSDTSDGDFVS